MSVSARLAVQVRSRMARSGLITLQPLRTVLQSPSLALMRASGPKVQQWAMPADMRSYSSRPAEADHVHHGKPKTDKGKLIFFS